MRICIIGPGLGPIPPVGWGAVESLIHDYRVTLKSLGHDVLVVNTPDKNEIIHVANGWMPDFIHIQYDDHIDVVPYLMCKNVAITNHYAYLQQPDKWGGWARFFHMIVSSNINIFSLSEGISNVYKANGVSEDRAFVIPNGVLIDKFDFSDSPKYKDRSMYLAKIDYRKRQHVFQDIPNLYFAGRISDNRFVNKATHLGEWSKDQLYKSLTDYSNLVLLSDGEAHPLVCLEAMSAGLGLVLSKYATANLDLSLPFIDVIEEEDINNLSHVRTIIENNRQTSNRMRNEIREYAKSFAWKKIINDMYVPTVESICSGDR